MKKVLCFFLATVICCTLLSCGTTPSSDSSHHLTPSETTAPISNKPTQNKNTAVPDSLVLRNVSLGENMTHEITHNYDAATHIDDVTLVTFYTGDFGVHTKTYTYSYQYDKSSDLWSLIGGNNGLQSDVTTLNPEAYIGKKFEGRFDQADSGQYSITVKDLDLVNETITINYLIMFDELGTLANIETLDLGYFTDGSGMGFNINYRKSMVVRFFISFSLDLIEGIRP